MLNFILGAGLTDVSYLFTYFYLFMLFSAKQTVHYLHKVADKVREEAVNKSKAIYLKTYIFLSGVGGDKSKVKMRATSIFQVVRNTTPNITLNVLKLFYISA